MSSTSPLSSGAPSALGLGDLRHPCHRDDVNLQEVGGEAILVDGRLGQAHVINGPAALAWRLCDGRRDIEQLATEFGRPFGLDGAAVRDDLVTLIEGFRQLGLMEPSGPPDEGTR